MTTPDNKPYLIDPETVHARYILKDNHLITPKQIFARTYDGKILYVFVGLASQWIAAAGYIYEDVENFDPQKPRIPWVTKEEVERCIRVLKGLDYIRLSVIKRLLQEELTQAEQENYALGVAVGLDRFSNVYFRHRDIGIWRKFQTDEGRVVSDKLAQQHLIAQSHQALIDPKDRALVTFNDDTSNDEKEGNLPEGMITVSSINKRRISYGRNEGIFNLNLLPPSWRLKLNGGIILKVGSLGVGFNNLECSYNKN